MEASLDFKISPFLCFLISFCYQYFGLEDFPLEYAAYLTRCYYVPLFFFERLCTSILLKEMQNRVWRYLSYLPSKDNQRRKEARQCLSQWLGSIQHSRNPLVFLAIILCWIDHGNVTEKTS